MRHRHDVESSGSLFATGTPAVRVTTRTPSLGTRALAAFAVPVLTLALAACGSGGGGVADAPPVAAAPDASGTVAAVDASALDPAGKPAAALSPVESAPRKTVNSVDQIVDDMKLMNDVPLAGIPKHFGFATGPGHIVMGADPRGTATPSWWNPSDPRYKSDRWWNALLPWVVVFDGEGNEASNTRVELGELKTWVRSRRTGEWKQVSKGPVEGWNYPKHLTGLDISPPDYRTHEDNRRSVRPHDRNAVFHGWCCGPASIEGADVDAVHITVQARLVVSDTNGPDDRARAKYLVHVGGDYYPDSSMPIEQATPAAYNPGLGMSRAKLVRDTWTAISFTTIDAGKVEPTGRAWTEAQLRAAPPPIE